jgi:uncharacterized protein YbaR (Trm112 family)
MTFEAWMDILRCPSCVTDTDNAQADPGQLDVWAGRWLVCRDCQRKYPIRNQIPVLLIEEGDKERDTPLEELAVPD